MAPKSYMNVKIKKLVLADERIGKVAKSTYLALAKATEIFACTLFKRMSALAMDYDENPRILKATHLKHCVKADPALAFALRLPSVEKAADFVAEEKISKDRREKLKDEQKAKQRAAKRSSAKRKASADPKGKQPAKVAKKKEEAVTTAEDPIDKPAAPDLSEDDDYDAE